MIRSVILRFLITGVSVVAVTYLIPGVTYIGGSKTLFEIVAVFFLANLFIKPILKIVTLPIEIATLGIFGLLINALIFWGVSVWIPEFQITSFWFSGISGSNFLVAPIEIPASLTIAISSVLMGIISTTLYWLTK